MSQKYSSAFSIGDHAALSLDRFGADTPYGVIDGILFYGPQVRYRVSLFVNDGPKSKPSAFRHEGRPVDGFIEDDLCAVTDQYVPHVGHVGRYEPVESLVLPCAFQMGQLVAINWSGMEDAQDPFNVPVMVTGVRYEEGKVLYDVSLQRKHYTDGSMCIDTSTTYGRLIGDSLSGIDSIFIKPLDGWPEDEWSIIQRSVPQVGDDVPH
ncbi:hypothetical protein YOLOSWAG_49 [Erwinia phage vB_EamM_Yoloswag]|uniref:Uncharacterized protein n=1 Tax=Erwinia phage vB_EamM_Yoloswag TaxID=1958956 RepID=A0A1S6L2Y5_9CAUD|nr:hypothetical protein HOR66_gp049 [Erwinia phage vB_EamM_Yoloswag]AQT28533.1 hypothetical protein YOLOSWAG_49 [Erwinia phage vB_EamM_Yoloswag]